MQVLIAEDDLSSRELLQTLLSRWGYKVTVAVDGEEAWQMMQQPDAARLVVLDWMMPRRSGIEVCQAARRHLQERLFYIILLTVRRDKTDILQGFAAGADDYITKPFEALELQARLKVGARIVALQDNLTARLREKELLLKEIHHRVKNNLQIIASLLQLQIDTITDPQTSNSLKDSQSRINAMALVHETLHLEDNLATIDCGGYLGNLVDHLFRSYQPGKVISKTAVEPITLNIDRAIPCGLIINELVSNALKHAFPNGRSGLIEVGLRRAAANDLIFTIRDDGCGLPAAIDLAQTDSLGLQLVSYLCSQLNGIIEVDRTGGTTFTLTIPGA